MLDPRAICRRHRDPCAHVTNPATTPYRSQDEYVALAGFQLVLALRRMNNAVLGARASVGTYTRFEGVLSDALWLANRSWAGCVGWGEALHEARGRDFYAAACRRAQSAATRYPQDWVAAKALASQRFLP